MIFAEAESRHADGPDNPRLEIGAAPDMVMHFTRLGVHEETVDREVATLGILGGRRERDASRVSAVDVRRVGPERGHLNLPTPARSDDRDHPERRADRQRPPAAEHLADNVGPGGCGHVVIGGGPAEQLVADTSSGPQRLMPRSAQAIDDAPGELPSLHRIGCDGCHGEC